LAKKNDTSAAYFSKTLNIVALSKKKKVKKQLNVTVTLSTIKKPKKIGVEVGKKLRI